MRGPVRKKIAGIGALGLFVLLLAGCGGDGPPRPEEVVTREPVPAHTREVIVTSDDATNLPEGCQPGRVAGLLIRFVDAFNQGRQDELSSAFFVSEGPAPPDFSSADYRPWSWYSSSKIGGGGKVVQNFTTSDQGVLLRYFARRHGQGERMRLLKVSLTQTGLLDSENNVGFVFVVTREAADLGGPARVAYGKGSLNCDNLRIFTWTMDMRAQEKRTGREAAAWLCADPPGWRPGKAVVACT